ncbi:H/ACA ribonucleoprotein complex non-core subunit NAF1-like [Nilaparvata lugens]|uniref:H/ACA ribonucleoprotein complex non-core subunit NAF1-like n=1 Tax=Nilaparvata lugens TaxID=108931 RepID=UPI00193E02C4|nr:H/ACA ribonucleoprotein complex non-core subunit NAF1-like [Nilaparvata lugens]
METLKEHCSGDTQQTGLQLETESQALGKNDPGKVNSVCSETGHDSTLIQTSSETIANNVEHQSDLLNGLSSSQEEQLGTGDENFYEPNNAVVAMEVEIESSSITSDQTCSLTESRPDEKMATSSGANDGATVCEATIEENSALKVIDGEGAGSSSNTEAAGGQPNSFVLCNSNALNALWGYGALISSDESGDEDEPTTIAAAGNTFAPRKPVVDLDSDFGSSVSSSSSLVFTDDSGSDDEQAASGEKNTPNARPKKPPMTDGELALEDLPPIEDLQITMPQEDCTKVGEVLHIVDKLVIVQGIKNMPPLDLESALFLSWDRPLGLIFDVFGPVCEPSYCVRFNSNEEIKKKNITPGMPVYFGPKSQYTNYVFMQHLLNSKGSDASWTGNNEPPLEQLDFSDDEAERAAKKAIKAINKEIKPDPDEPQRKKHVAYEERMNAMNLYMTRVSELKSEAQQRRRRPQRNPGRLLHSPVLSAPVTVPTFHQQPPPYRAAAPNASMPPPFAGPMIPFTMPPPPPTALPKPSMFVDTSRPPPTSPHMAFPPPNMSLPPPTTHFCNMSVPPPTAVANSRLFRANNSVNLNSLFPDLFVPPPPSIANTPFPAPPPTFGPHKDGGAPVANVNRLPPTTAPHFIPSTFHSTHHPPPTSPNQPAYSIYRRFN